MKKENLKSETITLKDLFSYDKKYIIPGYQRPYEWDEKQIAVMLKSIFNAFEFKPNEALLFGTVQFNVVKENQTEIGKEIIDGHQRFTTFYLLMKCLGKAPKIKYENQIVNAKQIDELIDNSALYNENYKYICNCADKYKIDKFIKFLEEQVVFIAINVSNCNSIDDTLQVFNSLNTTGLQLQVKDKFKIQYCDYLSKYSKDSKKEILLKINEAYNNISTSNEEIYSLEENVLLDVFKFYIMSKSKKNTWATDFRMSNSQFFKNIFNKNGLNENLELDVFCNISCCIKYTQELLKKQRDVLSVDGIDGFSKELIDWSGYGKLKNLYYYLIFIQYLNDKKITMERIFYAENLMIELLKLCSVFRFTHSKIINQVFNDVGDLVFNKLPNSKNAVYEFKTEYINKTIELKNGYPDRFHKFNTLFKFDGNVCSSNKPHLILAFSYIQDAQTCSDNISIKQIKEELFYRAKWNLDIEHIFSQLLYEKTPYVNSIGNLMYLNSNINKSLGVFTKKIQDENNAKQRDFENKLEKYKTDELISVKEFLRSYKDMTFIDSRNKEKINYIKEFYNYKEICED